MAARSRKRAPKAKGVKVDFAGVETLKDLPDGTYNTSVRSVELKDGEKAQYLAFCFEVTDKKFKGSRIYHNCSLTESALWNLKGVLDGLGVEVPDGEMTIDPDELVGLEAVVETEAEKYQGKNIPRLVDIGGDTDSDSDDDGGDDDDEAPTADEIMKMDLDELEEIVAEYDLDVDLDEIEGKGRALLKKQREAVAEAIGDSEEENGEDDKYTKEDILKMKRAGLEKVVEEHSLDLDLSDADYDGRTGIKQLREDVIECLEDEELIED